MSKKIALSLRTQLKRAQQERDILKKSRSVFCKLRTVRYAFIKRHSGSYPVRLLCEILGISKTRCYHWLNAPVGKRQKRQDDLDSLIKDVFANHSAKYGSTRIFHELKSKGVACTRAKLSERMKALNLIAKVRKKFKVTTDSKGIKAVQTNNPPPLQKPHIS